MRLIFALFGGILLLSGCSVSQRQFSVEDSSIAKFQADAKAACYKALKDSRPDMAGWSADKVTAYLAMEKLSQANLIIAGKSIDPCAEAGGTNVYDAEIAHVKADAQVKGHVYSAVRDALGKGLIGLGIIEFADAIEKGGFGGSQVNINGEGNTGTSSITRTSTEEWAGGGVGENAQGGSTGGGGLVTDVTDTPLTTDGVTFAAE